ncbi:MAG: chloride channel protein [Acidobacteria bacterium]|nr:chloride channel protein [Acidobacteriota bacterium]
MGRLPFAGDRLFLGLAIAVGVISGLAVVAFRLAIEWSRAELLGPALNPSRQRALVVPAAAGLVVAFLVARIFPRVRGSGVNQTKAALYIYNGYIPFRTAIGKFICCSLAIGAGHSLGPEDPSLQIGAALASSLGRRLKLSRDRLRLVAPLGAAAGLAAAFNAPVSAVLFVIEEVIGRWSAAVLGAVVLSALSSVVVTRVFLGAQPLFRIPAIPDVKPPELLAYAALGVAGGIAAVVFSRLIQILRPRLKALPRWSYYLQPAVAGLLIGAMAWLGAPQVMGAGYQYIDAAIHDGYTWRMMGMLAGLKILATTLSFTSGTPGGMFAPTLFIGAMLGGAVGGVERLVLPHLTYSIAAYSLVGMGVLFSGFLRAPLTSVFMVVEVSQSYSIVLPLILANTIAYAISRKLQPVPIFDMLTRQDGLELPSLEEQRDLPALHVEDAMRPPSIPILESGELAGPAWQRVQSAAQPTLFVRFPDHCWAAIAKSELAGMALNRPDQDLASVLAETPGGSEPLPRLYPDHSLDVALHYLEDSSVLLVVNRADGRKLEGIITLDDVLAAYRRTRD